MRTSSVVDGHPELPGQALERDREVEVALAPELGLVDLVVATDHERGVVLDEAVQRRGELVLVGRRRRRTTATQWTGSGTGGAGTVTGVPFGASVSPVTVPLSLATAAMSPAGTSATSSVLLAAQGEQAVEPLVGAGAGVHQVVVGADGARQHLEQGDLADERVGDGLEDLHQRLAGRVGGHDGRGVAGVDLDAPAGRAGTGPISQMKSARRSMPMRSVAEPHTTGNTVASSTPRARVCSSSSTEGMSPAR